jgi:flagellar protein FlbD
MIRLTHFKGTEFFLNAEQIISVESTPDVVITLTNHEKILVKERAEEVVQKIINYQRLVRNPDLEIRLGD